MLKKLQTSNFRQDVPIESRGGHWSPRRGQILTSMALMLALCLVGLSIRLIARGDDVTVPLALIAAITVSSAVVLSRQHDGLVVAGLALVLLTVYMRPGIVGELTPFPAVIILVALAIAARDRGDHEPHRGVKVWFGSLGVALLWPALVGSGSNYLVAGLNVALALLAGWVSFRGGQRLTWVSSFVWFGGLALWWQIIGYIPLLFNWTAATPLGSLHLPAREGWVYSISSAGSIVIGSGGIFESIGPRLTGWFGEPGIYAAFAAVLGLIDLVLRGKFATPVQTAAILTVLLTQSLAGIIVYAAGVSWFLFFSPAGRGKSATGRRFAGGLFAGVAAVAFLGNGTFSLASKGGINEASLSDRLSGTGVLELFKTWSSAPLGIGSGAAGRLGEINLLQSSITYGPIILILWLTVFLFVPMQSGSGRRWGAPLMAISVTVLFSQPPYMPVWIILAAVVFGAMLAAPLNGNGNGNGNGLR